MAGRFFDRNSAKIVICPAVASTAAPTRTEINAGLVVMAPGRVNDEAIKEVAGWEITNQPIAVPDGDSDFDKKIPGINSASDSSFVLYASKGVRTVRNALAKGSKVYVLLMWDGDVAGYPMQTWPVRVSANNDVPTLANDAHTYRVTFAPEEEPTINAVVPA